MKTKNHNKKTFGRFGILSFILSLLSISLYFTCIGDKNLGQILFSYLDIHFPVSILSVLLSYLSLYLSIKYKNQHGATQGKVISSITLVLILILILLQLLA